MLGFVGLGIERVTLRAMTRPAPPSARPRSVSSNPSMHPRSFPLYGASFDYVASPSKPIEGIVRLKRTGSPLAGVRVFCDAGAAAGSVSAVTDKDGRFRLDGLPKVASYKVVAMPDAGKPYQQASATVSDTEGLKPIPVTIDLPGGVLVKGRLIDKSTGNPVAGHIVEHVTLPTNKNPGGGTPAQLFGPEGFTMTVPPGPGLLLAQAEGKYQPYQRARLPEAVRRMGVGELGDDSPIKIIVSAYHACRMIDVPTDVETITVDLELSRGGSRRGRVVAPDGKDVSGVVVYGLSVDWEVKTLDDSGFEAIGLEPGRSRTVSFVHKDRRLAGSVDLESGGGPVEVRLRPCGSAVGRLVDPDGSPLAGAMVGVSLQNRRGEHIPLNIGLWPSGGLFTADQDGRFRVEGLNPDLVAHLGFRPGSNPGVFLIPEKE